MGGKLGLRKVTKGEREEGREKEGRREGRRKRSRMGGKETILELMLPVNLSTWDGRHMNGQ